MKKLFFKHKEIITYIIFGVLTTLINWCAYVIFTNMCGFTVLSANFLSWICGVVFAFTTNKIWVFNSKSFAPKTVIKEAISFISSRAVTGVLEVFGVPLLAKSGFDTIFYTVAQNLNLNYDILYTDGIYSKLAFAVIVVILNYVFSKLIVFKKDNKKR